MTKHIRRGLLLLTVLTIAVAQLFFASAHANAAVPAVNILVSPGMNGAQSDDDSRSPSISGDGRYVAFETHADNIVPNDTNNAYDVFVRDVTTGVTTMASVSSSGEHGDHYSGNPQISDNGRFVVFDSLATNLVPGDTGGHFQVYMHDLQTGMTSLVSSSAGGEAGDSDSADPAVDADGTVVIFQSAASNLVNGVANQVFKKDIATGAVTVVSANAASQPANAGSGVASISCDGSTVVFASSASNLTPDSVHGWSNVFLVSTTSDEHIANITKVANSASIEPVISCDGSTIAFESVATNLAGSDTNGSTDVFSYSRATEQFQMISVDSSGRQGGDNSGPASLSGDGRYVAFESENALDPSAGGLNNVNVFLRDTVTGTTEVVSRNATNAVGLSHAPAITPDARYIAFENQDSATSSAGKLSAADTNGKVDIYRAETGIPTTPPAPQNVAAPSPTQQPSLSWDAVSTATSYNVYRDGSNIGSTTGTSFIDSTAMVGQHSYYVTAVNNSGESGPSNTVTVQVGATPVFTSPSTALATARDPYTFTVTTTGSPTATITESGTLPPGIAFQDNGDGTATFSGQASPVNQGIYIMTLTATNALGTATQMFALSVNNAQTAPTILTANSATATYGVPFSFTINTTGYPIPNITKKDGNLPNGLKFKDNNDGTATISGTIKGNQTSGSATITIQAKNKNGTATQTFTISW